MEKPTLIPLSDGLFEIDHSFDRDPIDIDERNPEKAIKLCETLLKKYPYDFEAALIVGRLYNQAGDIEKACQVRYDAFSRLSELFDGVEVELDYESDENYFALELTLATAVDHFLISDFEMCAAMLEFLLDIDPEDHLGATRFLAYCYVKLGEWELFEDTLFDIDDKSAEKTLLEAWGQFKRNDMKGSSQSLQTLKKRAPDIFKEFKSDSHEITEEYLLEIEGTSPSNESLARELWLQTEHIWSGETDFIDFLREI